MYVRLKLCGSNTEVSGNCVCLIRNLNLGFSDWSCGAIFDHADADKSGSIDYPEFLQSFRAGVDAFGKDQGVM